MAILTVEAIQKSYGATPVVRGVSFAIEKGECFGLLGPNGAGKTTTLRLCLGLTKPDSGTIELAGHRIPEQARKARHRVGVVPQFDNLDPDFTVEENLIVFARYFGLREREVRPRIPALLEFAGLEGRADEPIASLSGGMKRRLTLARALVNDPAVLILDEPTTGLDPQARHLIWERLRRLRTEGKTIILTTHFMEEAERLCSRVAVMDNGALIATDTPRELIRGYIEPQVVEVHGDGVVEWARAEAPPLAKRVELVGETAFCYVDAVERIVANLARHPQLAYLHRPANLEDVFLKLTGRDLRD
ncbi:MAG: ATP-binding cassette domain-containing protein [Burkholderiales bacterium]